MGCSQSADVGRGRKLVQLLKSVDPFSDFPAEKLRELAQHVEVYSFVKGDVIEDVNDHASRMYIIAEGNVKLCRVSWALGAKGYQRTRPRADRGEWRNLNAGEHWGSDRLLSNRQSSSRSCSDDLVEEISTANAHTIVLGLHAQARLSNTRHSLTSPNPLHTCTYVWLHSGPSLHPHRLRQ